MSTAVVTKSEAAALLRTSSRSIERNYGHVMTGLGERAANGRETRGIPVSALPDSAQLEWARSNPVVDLVPTRATPGQLALSLVSPAAPNLSEEDRAVAERRYQIIALR